MFKEYMTSGELNPEVQATMKAATDIANGVLSLRDCRIVRIRYAR